VIDRCRVKTTSRAFLRAEALEDFIGQAETHLCPANDLPFSSERQGRVQAYHGREEPRAQPAASRHKPTLDRTRVAFGCCNGLFGRRITRASIE
jgi:hypothetical protein